MTTEAADKSASGKGWLDVAEVGSVWGIKIVLGVARLLGRRGARALVSLITWWWVLLNPGVRRHSRLYLARLKTHQGSPTEPKQVPLSEVRAHVLHFAYVALDRIFFLQGRQDLFEITSNGREHLQALAERGQGAILLGAHLGSFEAMRGTSRSVGLPLNIVGHFKNAAMINSVLGRLNPDLNARVIHAEPGNVNVALTLKERIAAGELVAILGDRTGLKEKHVRATFLGHEASFPIGPYLLATILDCPVLLTFGLYRGDNRYDLHCEPFADTLKVPRKERKGAMQAQVQRYAQRLEHHLGTDARNWFNFYDFWR